jgi:hypothetical protein
VASEFFKEMPGHARQRWGGRWNATKPPAPGGQPRGGQRVELTPQQEEIVRRRRVLQRGSRAIAEEIGVGRHVVRRFIVENGL